MSKTEPELFNFQNPTSYLIELLNFKQKENAHFSLRAWSLKMGFSSPSTLSEIISNKRKIIPNHIPKILRGLKLKPVEKNYFQALVYFENAEGPSEKEHFLQEIEHLKIIQHHEHSFNENLVIHLHDISEVLRRLEELKTHIEEVKTKKGPFEKYELLIQFGPSR